MEHWELRQMQSLPLELKVIKTQQRIKEWYDKYDGQVYISFSGGKDSTVLLHIARGLYPDIPAVFCDTGLEYPEVRNFVHTQFNVTILRPKMGFKEVIEKYGYPVISKEQAQYISEYKHTKSEKLRNIRWNGNKSNRGKISIKWRRVLDAPFEVSDKCCDIMKKNPAKAYEKSTGRKAIIGVMASESSKRVQDYLKFGCNAFDAKRPMSRPMGFWSEQDVLEYLMVHKIPYASVYGNIVIDSEGIFSTTGVDRTGYVFCGFGAHLEPKDNNRFHRLQRTHPKLHGFCMDGLGMRDVLEYIGVSCGITMSELDTKCVEVNVKESMLIWISNC